ncbi:MAG TPA: twin-arginine translocation signal domain-containing protein, partial [Terriglobales bacterium]|nr:twin-arginine translocation signal domain-containing protein [Terriglobales bacterium]
MNHNVSRRQFLQASAVAGAGLALPKNLLAAGKKSVLIFTKSSGFEHDVIKVTPGHPSILEQAVKTLGEQHGFEVTATKDGRVFDSADFKKHAALLFFT